VLGFLRKDIAVGMLAALDLTPKQLIISVTILAMSFPCIARHNARAVSRETDTFLDTAHITHIV